ncbi:jg11426 [Pararge aegeria aegeria]|uniref:Jg11426 protein n=1 Tax=Pararge aegeria aegeria TaxID=348720 RepID=A0A8S4RXW6_9NEOP|nr:jg11426 [Pararge aegeria aegeria]
MGLSTVNKRFPGKPYEVIQKGVDRGSIPLLRIDSVTFGCPRRGGSLTETARLLQNVRSVFGRRSATRVNMELELSRKCARPTPPHLAPPRPGRTQTAHQLLARL